MKKNNRTGFTLIELLVVIAIIGLLASIVLASLNSARKKSRDARRVADLKQLQNALELYANDFSGNYPSNATTGGASGRAAATGMAALVPTYIPAIPGDPLAGAITYVYRTNSAGANNATIYCMGSKVEGTPPSPANTCQAAVTTFTAGDTDTTTGGNQLPNYQVGN